MLSRQQALHEPSLYMPGSDELSEDRAGEEGSAGTEDSFSGTTKACPSCFATLVPTTKGYKQNFWAQTSRLVLPTELKVALNKADLFVLLFLLLTQV